jgi:hypothetical protein
MLFGREAHAFQGNMHFQTEGQGCRENSALFADSEVGEDTCIDWRGLWQMGCGFEKMGVHIFIIISSQSKWGPLSCCDLHNLPDLLRLSCSADTKADITINNHLALVNTEMLH